MHSPPDVACHPFGVAALTLLLAFAGLGTPGENRKLREDVIRFTGQQREREKILDGLARDLYISRRFFFVTCFSRRISRLKGLSSRT
jgi:hypothetical protein